MKAKTGLPERVRLNEGLGVGLAYFIGCHAGDAEHGNYEEAWRELR